MENLKQEKPSIRKIADVIKEYVAVFSLLILIIGIIQQYIYYQLFDFNILPYLDLSSLTINFINNFFLSILMVSTILVFDFTVNHINHRIPLVLIIFLALIFPIQYLFNYNNSHNNPFALWNLIALLCLLLCGCALLRFTKLHFHVTGKNKRFYFFYEIMNYIFFIFFITVIPIQNTITDQEKIIRYRSLRNCTLIGEHTFIRAFDENLFLIGQTTSNYFIYNKSNFSMRVIDKSEIQKVIVYKLN